MVVNAVAPWEGQLIWVGTPNGGFSQQTGQEWKSVEFALKYTDMRLQEKQIVFSAFGLELTNRILSIPLGTTVRVTWSPEARPVQQQDGSVKWYGKLSAFGVTAQQSAQPAPQPMQAGAQQPQYQGQYAPKPAYQQGFPQYPPQGTQMPTQAPVYQQQPAPQSPASGSMEDLPFD